MLFYQNQQIFNSFTKIGIFIRYEHCAVPWCEDASNLKVATPSITYNPYGVQDTIEVHDIIFFGHDLNYDDDNNDMVITFDEIVMIRLISLRW